jgi:pilus assembly protein Flp/PilA
MFELFKRFFEQEEGQDLVEYALLLVFIALIVIAALPGLGTTVSNVFSNTTSLLQSGS